MQDKKQYRGDFVAWSGGALFIGSGGVGSIAPHAHYAIQIVASPAGLKVQAGRRSEWVPCGGPRAIAVHAHDRRRRL
jgi:hypothetical protein